MERNSEEMFACEHFYLDHLQGQLQASLFNMAMKIFLSFLQVGLKKLHLKLFLYLMVNKSICQRNSEECSRIEFKIASWTLHLCSTCLKNLSHVYYAMKNTLKNLHYNLYKQTTEHMTQTKFSLILIILLFVMLVFVFWIQ